ncbi:MAG: tRNA pseudouridine(54/55) synthase Pus10 [Archaeoglobi archaeon]|nr:tRNA pseudouridine(54/55) synthase Pus10 [Archaeoglobi archaeon]
MIEVCEHCRERLGFGTLGKCVVCCNAFDKIELLVRKILGELKDYEFETFDIGVSLYGSSKAIEEWLRDEMGVEDSLKDHFRREFIRAFSRLSGRKRELNGDVRVVVNLEDLSFTVSISPVYIYGRYKKRVRYLSQTRWICQNCMGKGCELCSYEGRKYLSVEDLIIQPALELFGGENAYLHGSGREDVDARMLGSGRPFVLEISNPRRRKVDLSELEKRINEHAKGKVEVRLLFYASHKDVERIKSAGYSKVYRAIVRIDGDVSDEDLIRALKALENTVIHQRTPRRVEHRRADRVRKRRVISARLIARKGRYAVVEIHAESGLYIKELVSGDEGRTRPSLSEILGVRCVVEKLDVLEVLGGLESDGNLKYNPVSFAEQRR